MLWIIEPDRKTLTQEYAKDLERLRGNAAISEQIERCEISFSLAEARSPLAEPALPADEPIYVMAHAGNDPTHGLWIAGVLLNDFIPMLVAKFGTQLNNRKVYLLVCLVGGQTLTLATQLQPHASNVDLYVPNGLMYISAKGIPHLMRPGFYTDLEVANKDVAKYDAEFTMLASSSQVSGEDWSGAHVPATPAVPTALASHDVRDHIREIFDPEEDEA